MGSRSIIAYFEAQLPQEPIKKTQVVVNTKLSPQLIKYMKKDKGLAQNVSSTLATLERDAIMRARMRLNNE